MRRIPGTELRVHPLYLGGNTFGWSSNREQLFAVLDAYRAGGGNFIDTADMYSEWAPGNRGGESEEILGSWMKARGCRKDVVLATKVAKLSTRRGLSPANIAAAIEDSLRRLQTDYVDLYYAHEDDSETPLEDTLLAFAQLQRAGMVRHIAASQYSAPRLAEALRVARELGVPGYVGLQTHYNLMERADYESGLQELCVTEELACFPFFGLARGFLSGKYQPGLGVESARAEGVLHSYGNDRGWAVLEVLHSLAAEHDVSSAAVALEWLRQRPGVVAPLASARTVEQLGDLMQEVALSAEDRRRLDAVSER